MNDIFKNTQIHKGENQMNKKVVISIVVVIVVVLAMVALAVVYGPGIMQAVLRLHGMR